MNSQANSTQGALSRAKDAEIARQPKLASRIALSLCAMVIGLIVLAAKTNIPNVTRASGEILPNGNYSQVETLEGGIVDAIHVVEGQVVEAGAPLLDLKQPDLQRRIGTLRMQHDNEQTRLENLDALRAALAERTPPTNQTVEGLHRAGLTDAADQLELYVQTQRSSAMAIERHSETLKILAAALAFSNERVSNRLERMDNTQILRDQGLITARQHQVEEDQLNGLRTAANTARVDLAEARSELIRMKTDRDRARLDLQEKTLSEIHETRIALVDLSAELLEANARRTDLSIVAPEAGVIQSVAMPNLGEVIEPGETLFEIVPMQRGLVIEARIPSGDIGHVDDTQSVSIGVDTFDSRRFGKLTGQLLSLSPVPLTDQVTGEHYFRAAIGLDQNYIGQGNMERPLRTGMTVVAEIVTGEQTVLAYFLKPIDATLKGSFRER
ncbi:MAG: HlyD family type I secretion periplasmic adaptor subunit [Roseobacter sp.]